VTAHAAAGKAVPGGTFRVEEYERVISHDALAAPPLEPPLLHPVWAILGALRGMGTDLADVFALVDASEDGTLFGEAELEQLRPLRAGVDYAVLGGVTDVVRREGRRAGAFDVLTLRLEIVEPGGESAAVVSQAFIIPRGQDAHA
jgi:hypothetical protein